MKCFNLNIEIVEMKISREYQEDRPKYGKFLVDADDGFDEVVVVDATDKVGQEVLSDVIVHTGEQELEQIQHTRAEVRPAKVLEDQVSAEISGLQLCLVAVLEVLSEEVPVTQHSEVLQILTPHTHSVSHGSHEDVGMFVQFGIFLQNLFHNPAGF